MAEISIPTPPEFSYELNLEFLQRSPRELLHKVEGGNVIKALKIGETKLLCSVKPAKNSLKVEFLNSVPSEAEIKYAKDFVTEWFDLKTDLSLFYKKFETDSLIGPLIKRYHGYRIIGQPDLFESVIWAVIGQQINLSFAYTLKQRFVEKFGERILYNNESYFLFPEPRIVAKLTDEVLLPLQFSRQKVKYIAGIAQAFDEGTISKERLAGLRLEIAKEELMKIKGIGNWTANYALMKTFRYPDAFPLEDAGIHNAIKNLKQLKQKPSIDGVKKIFKRFKGWEAYATLYLWKSLTESTNSTNSMPSNKRKQNKNARTGTESASSTLPE